MAFRFQKKRGTAAQWASVNPVLAHGEPGWETDTRKEKTGDGVTAWNSLPYNIGSGSVAWADVTGTPTTRAGYGITDAAALTHNHNGVYEPVFSKNTGFNKNFGTTAGTVSEGNHTHDYSNLFAAFSHNHTFASITSKPTTLTGYGITDAVKSVNGVTPNAQGNVTIEAGSNITVDSALSLTSENPVQNKVLTPLLQFTATAGQYNPEHPDFASMKEGLVWLMANWGLGGDEPDPVFQNATPTLTVTSTDINSTSKSVSLNYGGSAGNETITARRLEYRTAGTSPWATLHIAGTLTGQYIYTEYESKEYRYVVETDTPATRTSSISAVTFASVGEATLEAASTTLDFTNPFGHVTGTSTLTQAGAVTFTKTGTLKTSVSRRFVSDGSAITFNFAHEVLNNSFVSGGTLAAGTYKLYFINEGDVVTVSIATVGAGTTSEPTAPDAPTALTFSNTQDTTSTAAWTAPADTSDVAGYNIYVNGTKQN